jgi:hypothetical protein
VTLPRKYASAFAEEAQVVATLDISAMWDRLMGEALTEWARLNREGVTGEALGRAMRARLEGLSEKPLDDLARKSTSVAYNQGRSAEIQWQADLGRVEQVVRSEILDDRTCEVCVTLDGAVVDVDSEDYHRLMPPALCQGGERCRGFYVGVAA